MNEDINISSVKMYIDKLNLGIRSYLAAENNARRESFMREIRHTFKSIDNATRRTETPGNNNDSEVFWRNTGCFCLTNGKKTAKIAS